ncbi:helix-turn-helix domain-containing protein [Microvirga arabica]|uniref:helix-turn-helix domain-containing protein n=1 Tax=Microvirga arabica TaxID=1128671 RepID=UPI001939ED0D|nr:helix-turn-helix domain-containing protein [Microvirga arabica]MBM1175550.1 helix-turn-helix domain-containing protein [Microvirga arabica]
MSIEHLHADSQDDVSLSSWRVESLRDQFGLLSPSDLATLLNVDTRTLATWRARGAGPDFAKLGRSVFYRRTDVESWIELNVMPMDRTIG